MARTLLEQIEEDALDSQRSVADALRKCIALGGRANSDELRAWASRELEGYKKPEDVPEYRVIAAPIVIDGVAGYSIITAEPISTQNLPEPAREAGISESLRLTNGIGELEEMARRATENNEAVKLGLPQGALIAQWMTRHMGEPDIRAVQRVYWNVSPTSIFGIVDQVRTKLVELVSQIRADTGSAQDPSRDAVENAVNVVFRGEASRVTVNTAQSTDSSTATVTQGATDASPPWWRTTKAVWGFAVGAATIVATLIAYLQLS